MRGLSTRVGDVHQQIDEHVRRRRDQHDALHHRVVAREHGLHDEPTEAGQHEDLLGDDGAAHERAHLQPEDRHHRDEPVAERVAHDDGLLGQALGAGGAHVVGAQHLDHRVARLAHEHRGQPGAEHERRHEHALEIADGILGERHEAGGGQPAEAHGDEQDQHDPEPEVGDRHAAQRHPAGQHVPGGVAADGRHDPGRNGDGQRDQQRQQRQLDRDRQLGGDHPRHRRAGADRLAEVAGRGQAEPAQVLHRQRSVESVLLADLLDPGGVGVGAGQHPGRIAGDHPHAGEDDQADEEQRDRRDERPADEELDHAGATARTSP